MDNKNDWIEIEKWNIERMEKYKEQYGVYPQEYKNNEKINKLAKGLNITVNALLIIKHIITAIIIFVLLSILMANISNLSSQLKDASNTTETSFNYVIEN